MIVSSLESPHWRARLVSAKRMTDLLASNALFRISNDLLPAHTNLFVESVCIF